MRYVIVPMPIDPTNVDGKRFQEQDPEDKTGRATRDVSPVSLHRYLMKYVINEHSEPTPTQMPGMPPRMVPKIGVGYEANKRIGKLDRSFRDAKPFDVVAVEDADWQKVKEIIEQYIWRPVDFGACMLPLEEAWMNAVTDDRQIAERRAAELRSAAAPPPLPMPAASA